jgi:hypothetical protein
MTDHLKQRPGDQPLPTPGRDCVQDALIAAIENRKQLGISRYGSPLMTHNGRDALRDAWEESIDLAAYLTQMRMERYDVTVERDRYREAIEKALAWMPEHTLTESMAPDGVAPGVNAARDVLRKAVGGG